MALLKIDCEGCEHEVLPSFRALVQGRVSHVVGELHSNALLRRRHERRVGLTADSPGEEPSLDYLERYVRAHVPAGGIVALARPAGQCARLPAAVAAFAALYRPR